MPVTTGGVGIPPLVPPPLPSMTPVPTPPQPRIALPVIAAVGSPPAGFPSRRHRDSASAAFLAWALRGTDFSDISVAEPRIKEELSFRTWCARKIRGPGGITGGIIIDHGLVL